MCGRYGRRADKQRIAEWFRTHNTDVFNDPELASTYNATPQSFQPVIRLNPLRMVAREIAHSQTLSGSGIWGRFPHLAIPWHFQAPSRLQRPFQIL
jgi:putative SOS response-associated peptidase YedK